MVQIAGAGQLKREVMANYMITYYGGNQPSSEEEGMAQMNKWKAWVESLGDTIVNLGTPLPVSKIVKSSSVEDDKDPNSMKGFAVVKAESIEAAIEIAKSDPFLENGGTIRVSQMMEMKYDCLITSRRLITLADDLAPGLIEVQVMPSANIDLFAFALHEWN